MSSSWGWGSISLAGGAGARDPSAVDGLRFSQGSAPGPLAAPYTTGGLSTTYASPPLPPHSHVTGLSWQPGSGSTGLQGTADAGNRAGAGNSPVEGLGPEGT